MLRARLVRDYLELEFQNSALPFPFSLEHVVDDFVLFCMLIGNDFLPCEPLPHSPTPCRHASLQISLQAVATVPPYY